MSQNEILLFANALAAEKKVSPDTIINAIERTMEQVVAKEYGEGTNINVVMDRNNGTFLTKMIHEVIDDAAYDELEIQGAFICLSEAKKNDSSAQVGDVIEKQLDIDILSRITAHNAKQIMSRQLRELDRERTAQKYQERIGQLITTTVKKLTKDFFVLETQDGTELMLPKSDVIPKESIRIGDRVKSCITGLNDTNYGPVVVASRTSPLMINALFEIEVPEITDGAIEIKAACREPGVRAKVAVKGIDKRIDPIGACVGMRGIRVQSISNELNGERIDIIAWNDDPARLAIAAIAPAEVKSVYVDENNQCIDLIINSEQLSQAIGKNGQNIRLASQLIGWELNVKSDDDELSDNHEEQVSSEPQGTSLDTLLSIDEVTIIHLESAGIHSVEDLNQLTIDQLKDIDGIDEDIAESILAEAQLFI